MLDIDELNKKSTKESLGIVNNNRLEQLESKMEKLQEDNEKLKVAVSSLSSTNQALEKEILEVKQRFNSNILHKSDNEHENLLSRSQHSSSLTRHLSDKADVQVETDRMQSIMNQANSLLIRDATHPERISNLESQVSEINGKLQNLESADLYLQEAHKVLTERTSLIEKYSRYIEEKVKLVTSTSPAPETVEKLDDLDRRVDHLEKHQHLHISNVNYKLRNDESSIQRNDNITFESSNLQDKYLDIFNRVSAMEELLNKQANTLSEYSKMFSEKMSRSYESNERKLKETEITRIVSKKLSEIKKEEYSRYSKITDLINLKPETILCSSKCHIIEFIEILVGMNKSLNQIIEDFMASQIQIKSLKMKEKTIESSLQEQTLTLKNELNKLHSKLESDHIKQVKTNTFFNL